MSTAARLTLAAALATFLGALPLSGSFSDWGWLGHTIGVIVMVAAIGLALRALRAPEWTVVPTQAVGLLLFATAAFASADAFAGFIPTLTVFDDFATLVSDGIDDVQYLAAPVPATTEMIAMTSVGVGAVAVVVDLVAAGLRRPAVAGLALLALFAVATSITDGVPWIEFGMAAAGYLVLLAVEERERLLAWGRVVTANPAPHQQSDPRRRVHQRPRYATASRIGVLTLAVALLVPAAVPGLSRNLLAKIGSTDNGLSRAGDGNGSTGPSLSPFTQLQGSLNQAETIDLFTVKSTVNNPYYLRTIVLDEYTSAGWRLGSDDSKLTKAGPDLPLGPDVGTLQGKGQTREVTSTITIDKYRDRYLPIYYSAQSVSPPTDGWTYDYARGDAFTTHGKTRQDDTYRVRAIEPRPTQQALAAAPPVSAKDPMMQRWGELPSISDEVKEITDGVVKGSTTPWAKSVALYNYFTDGLNGFQYSLQTQEGTSSDALLNFLTEKQGFCEQYASAMAVMLRLQGIPARVVLGYTAGTYDSAAQTWTVTNRDAHAWVEGYFSGIGWVEFDPTPLGDGRTQYQPYLPDQTTTPDPDPTDAPGTTAPTEDASPAPQSTTTAPTVVVADPDDTTSTTPFGAKVAAIVAAAVVVLALLAIPAASRIATRRRRLGLARGPDPGLAAHGAWDELLATAADLGIRVPNTDSTRAAGRRLTSLPGLDQTATSAISLIAAAEERSTYGRQAGVDGDLGTALQAARRGLLADVPGGRRLWLTVAPRSVLGNLRAARGSRYAQTRSRLGAMLRGLLPAGR